MSALTVLDQQGAVVAATTKNHGEISAALAKIGVQFEQWQTGTTLDATAEQQKILDAYADSIATLNTKYGFTSVDVVSLKPDHPDKAAFRQKFLAEHTHDDFEVRFFVDGSGLFYLHVDGKIYLVVCEKGDLISVPANTTHWFDMGTNPSFTCIRFFTKQEGWVGNFTGNDIASTIISFDDHLAAVA